MSEKEIVKSEEQFEKVLDGLPEKDKKVIINQMGIVMAEKSFSGPLPPPDYMEKYEKTLPGAADRIIAAYEKQVDHRTKQEAKIVDNEFMLSKKGQSYGFWLCIFFGILAMVCVYTDHEILAGIIFSTLIIALAVVFVLNKYPSFMDKKIEE